MVNKIEIVVTGKNLTKPEFDAAVRDARNAGQTSGDQFSRGFEDEVKDRIPPAVDEPLNDLPDKGRESGQKTGDSFNKGASPLLLAAFTGAATIGPAAILAGMSTAVVGAGVLIAKSNADIKAEYGTLATDVSKTMTAAVQPLVPSIQAAMVQADSAVSDLGPVLQKTFADASPDVGALTSGITGLTSNALPGLDTAISGSRGIVSGFAGSLPDLGAGVGRFFTGLTTDAQTTERGIVDFVNVSSNALGTLGRVGGSASAALSEGFSTVAPVLNGTLTAIDKIANPATVGAVAGIFGAMKLDPAISTGLGKAATGLLTLSERTAGASGLTDAFSGATLKSAGALGKAADVMAGPWGLAIGAGLGLMGGLVSTMGQAAVTAADFTGAIAQDNGVIGANTTATIQNMIAKSDLNSMAQVLGVSQATLIEYAAGETQAQNEVAQAYQRVLAYQQANTSNSVAGLQAQKAQLDQFTKAVADAVAQQNDQNKAYLAATHSANIFSGMVDSSTVALQTNAGQAGINTVAALQLSGAQESVTQHLANQVGAFQLATAQASAYKTVLDASFGRYQDYSQAQATFTTDVDNASKALTKGKDAIDLNTTAGAANFTVLSGLATQNEAVAESLLKQTGNQDQANKALQAGAAKIDALAKSAGFSATQISQLNTDLYGTASIKDINVTVGVNTAPAYQGVSELVNFINSTGAVVHVYETPSGVYNTGMTAHAKATGGVVGASASVGAAFTTAASGGARGSLTLVGEQGPELVNLPFGSQVHSAPDTQRMMSDGGLGGGQTLRVELEMVPSGVGGDLEQMFATAFHRMMRTGRIQIRKSAIVGNGF